MDGSFTSTLRKLHESHFEIGVWKMNGGFDIYAIAVLHKWKVEHEPKSFSNRLTKVQSRQKNKILSNLPVTWRVLWDFLRNSS